MQDRSCSIVNEELLCVGDYVAGIYAEYYPHVSGEVEAWLSECLRRIVREADHGAVFTSTLTGDGLPLELAFSTAVADVRYTLDFVHVEATARLAYLNKLLSVRSRRVIPPKNYSIPDQATTSNLKYGAWLGCRHSSTGTRHKLYIEACPQMNVTRSSQHDHIRQYGKLCMLGLQPYSGSVEYYYRCPHLEGWQVDRICRDLGGPRVDVGFINEKISEAYGRKIIGQYPSQNTGISLAFCGDDCVGISLFFFARTILGGDLRARTKILSLADKYAWDLACYEAMTRPLTERHSINTYHGLVSFCFSDDSYNLGVGVRPVYAAKIQ